MYKKKQVQILELSEGNCNNSIMYIYMYMYMYRVRVTFPMHVLWIHNIIAISPGPTISKNYGYIKFPGGVWQNHKLIILNTMQIDTIN